jgi:PhnB protein
MPKATSPIPAGYHSVTPYLCVKGAAKAIEFYVKAFGATEQLRMGQPDGRIGHAEIQIGDSRIMLADEFPERGFLAPKGGERVPVMLHIYLADVDAVFARALDAGAKSVRPIADQFYWRPRRHARRPVRSLLVRRDPRRGRLRGRTAAPDEGRRGAGKPAELTPAPGGAAARR